MKYIIKEDRFESLIEKYIISNYERVMRVEFDSKKVHLGSGPNEKGETRVTQKRINVYLDNIDGDAWSKIRDIKMKILDELEETFGLDFYTYGSPWDFKFFEVIKQEL